MQIRRRKALFVAGSLRQAGRWKAARLKAGRETCAALISLLSGRMQLRAPCTSILRLACSSAFSPDAPACPLARLPVPRARLGPRPPPAPAPDCLLGAPPAKAVWGGWAGRGGRGTATLCTQRQSSLGYHAQTPPLPRSHGPARHAALTAPMRPRDLNTSPRLCNQRARRRACEPTASGSGIPGTASQHQSSNRAEEQTRLRAK